MLNVSPLSMPYIYIIYVPPHSKIKFACLGYFLHYFLLILFYSLLILTHPH